MGIIAGILLILISGAHHIYGEKRQIPAPKEVTNNPEIVDSLRVMIHQDGIILFAVGIVQILSATQLIELKGVANFFLVGIVFLNFSIFLIIAIVRHRELLQITLPQVVVFTIIITLQHLSL